MELRYMQRLFDGGRRNNPIILPVAIQSTTDADGATAYIRLPVPMRILGARVRAFGTLGGTADVTIKKGQVSAGVGTAMEDYAEPMTAAEVAAVGVTIAPVSTPDLFIAAPDSVDDLFEAGADADLAVNGYGVLAAGDILIINVAQTTTETPIYQIDIWATSTEV